jgi:hypothetical protein
MAGEPIEDAIRRFRHWLRHTPRSIAIGRILIVVGVIVLIVAVAGAIAVQL